MGTAGLPARRRLFGREENIGMQVLVRQPACFTQVHGCFDHCWRARHICLPATEVVQVPGDGVGDKAGAQARPE